MNQQQHGDQGRHNRNRGRGGGGGQGRHQGGNALNIPGIPQQVFKDALASIEVGELGDHILDRLEADGRRADETHDDQRREAEQRIQDAIRKRRDDSAETALKRVQARQDRSLALGKGNAEINRLRAEAAAQRVEAEIELERKQFALQEQKVAAEKERRETESAARKAAREAAAKVGRGFALFTRRMTVARFSGEYRRRVTHFQDQLTPEARKHFHAVLAACEDEEQIRSILMALSRIKSDEERFNTARNLGLIPENYHREERRAS